MEGDGSYQVKVKFRSNIHQEGNVMIQCVIDGQWFMTISRV